MDQICIDGEDSLADTRSRGFVLGTELRMPDSAQSARLCFAAANPSLRQLGARVAGSIHN